MKTETAAVCMTMILTTGVLLAQVPNVINYQGRLVDGETLVNGDVSLELRLYNSPTDGTPLYADSNTVTVVDGLYSTHIGDDTIMGSLTNALTNAMVYLEVVVDGAALTPRERLVAVPYSLRAARSDRLGHGALDAVGERIYITDTIFLERMADGTIGVRDPWGRVWTHPSGLSDNISLDGWNADFPQVAMDDNGSAIIVWQQPDGSKRQIFKSEYRSGVWIHPADLADNISPDGQHAAVYNPPRAAMANNGDAIIVWEQSDGVTGDQIFKSEYRSGVWTHPTNLTDNVSPDDRDASFAQVAMDNNGNAIIVWEQSDGVTGDQIFKSEYRSGTWTHPSNLTDNISPDGLDANLAQVAMADNGNAIIVWEQSDGSTGDHIFKSEYRSGIWMHPSNLTHNISPDGQHANLAQVAMDNNGNAIIVWEQSDGATGDHIFKSEYRSGTWTHPSNLTDNISLDGQHANLAQVAMDDNGNAIIVWEQNDGSTDQIFKSEYRSGTWTHPSDLADNISPDGGGAVYQEPPHVVMDNTGNVIITWEQQDGVTGYRIFKSEYRFGNWMHPGDLTDNISPDGSPAYSPQVATDGDGNAIIVWLQKNSASKDQIFKSERR